MRENEMINDVAYILYSEEQIKVRVKELADEISREYAGKNPLMIGILKGVYPFYADLLRELNIQVQSDFIVASSYGNGTESSGRLNIKKDTDVDLTGRHVIIVEDIIDSGNTLFLLKKELQSRGAVSVKTAALLNKQARRECPIQGDFIGFECANEFVIGYGLDYAERYRNLPFVGVLKKEIYQG